MLTGHLYSLLRSSRKLMKTISRRHFSFSISLFLSFPLILFLYPIRKIFWPSRWRGVLNAEQCPLDNIEGKKINCQYDEPINVQEKYVWIVTVMEKKRKKKRKRSLKTYEKQPENVCNVLTYHVCVKEKTNKMKEANLHVKVWLLLFLTNEVPVIPALSRAVPAFFLFLALATAVGAYHCLLHCGSVHRCLPRIFHTCRLGPHLRQGDAGTLEVDAVLRYRLAIRHLADLDVGEPGQGWRAVYRLRGQSTAQFR